MSILIKGMEMPDACCDCDLLPEEINRDEQWRCPITKKIVQRYLYNTYIDERKGKPSDCPLVEIPPHGDLIDVDNLIEDIEELDNKPLKKWLKRFVNGSAVIVESEEE